jgi:hypothetical protein
MALPNFFPFMAGKNGMLEFFILGGIRLMIVAYMLEMYLFLPLRHRCAFFMKQLRKTQYHLIMQFLDLIKLLIKRMTSPSPCIKKQFGEAHVKSSASTTGQVCSLMK